MELLRFAEVRRRGVQKLGATGAWTDLCLQWLEKGCGKPVAFELQNFLGSNIQKPRVNLHQERCRQENASDNDCKGVILKTNENHKMPTRTWKHEIKKKTVPKWNNCGVAAQNCVGLAGFCLLGVKTWGGGDSELVYLN